MFVSGSQDKTARLWDLRAPAAVNVIPSPSPGFTPPPHRHLTSRSLEVILCLRFSFCAVTLLMGLREGHLALKILAPHP